jgi:hypothetical protein
VTCDRRIDLIATVLSITYPQTGLKDDSFNIESAGNGKFVV